MHSMDEVDLTECIVLVFSILVWVKLVIECIVLGEVDSRIP